MSAVGACAALAVAGLSALSASPAGQTAVPAPAAASSAPARSDRPDRDAARPTLTPTPAPSSTTSSPDPSRTPSTARRDAVGTRYTRVDLNVRTEPDDDAKLITVLDAGTKVSITDDDKGAWQGVVYKGQLRWVHERYLVKSKPKSTSDSSGGLSGAPCGSGSSVEHGLTPDGIRVHRAVCHQFPQITRYGGVRADSLPEHPSGRAVDCMLPGMNATLGWQIANWVRAHAKELGVSQVLYNSHIWTVQRSSEGWRPMPDRGGATANHRDHVHVTVYGSSGTS